MTRLSLIIPVFNESAMISHLGQELSQCCRELSLKYGWKQSEIEICIVDDGSSDSTWSQLVSLQLPATKRLLRFSRNFGHQSSLLAGLAHATGELMITLDGDLQHPTSLIPEMINQAKAGAEVVLTQRITSEVSVKSITSLLFYKFFSIVTRQPYLPGVADFRLLTRKAVKTLLSLPEKRLYLRGMVQWIGFRTVILPYTQQPRIEGKTKYSWGKMTRLALNGITSFSTEPLYWSFFFGISLFLLAMIYALYVLIVKLFAPDIVSGWASELFVQLILGGSTSLFLGVLGAYVAAIYDEVKQRPPYIIAEETK